MACAKRSSNSSQAALKPAFCVSYLPPGFEVPATARNTESTGFPLDSIGCNPAFASTPQSASSSNAAQTPASGRPSRLVNFLVFKRLEVLPTSRGTSWPRFACSSKGAQGSAMAGSAFFSSTPSAPSFFMGVLASCLAGVCACFTTWPSSSSSAPPLSSASSGLAFSSGRSLSSSCRRSSRSWTSRGGAGTRGPSMQALPWSASSVIIRSSRSLASDSCRRYTPVRCTVQELMRNSFFLRSAWSLGIRKSGTRRCMACRCSGAPWSRKMLRPSLMRWSMVRSSSVSGMGDHSPLCVAFAFLPALSFLSRASKSSAWYTSWYSSSTFRE
mmetsp:Transcript_41086/g.118725  ORF Transcript_41086/g.118725 Transcript_41086/m.118725 type:complete len:328 (-) Transcript_41086:296-1279(-)